MMKNRIEGGPREIGDVVSIIGPGMKIVGDCSSDGTIRVEGRVEGLVAAAKSVVVGKEGEVVGDIRTQDAIIAGSVTGSVTAESRVELQATCRIKGDIQSRRVKLDEGGQVDGKFHMGVRAGDSGKARHQSEDRTSENKIPAAVTAASK
jgi:cytoskeletal protein CcmA (bactofilin family)